MARKGNPISVRLDLNRSSDSSWFSDFVLESFLFLSEGQRKFTKFFMGAKPIKNLPMEIKVLSLLMVQFLGMAILFRLSTKLGMVFMDELGEAIRPFLPHPPSGMPGEGGAAPGPFGDGGPVLLAPSNENQGENPTPDSVAGGNPPEGQPAPNAAAEQPYDAGIGPQEEGQPVEAFPYADDQVIGGDSVNRILSRLLGKHPPFPPSEVIDLCRIEARDLMEVKAEIIQYMAPWDQGGDWVGSGARALDNPRTATGEESLENLYKILEDLNETGPLSDSFSKLQEKVRRLP